MNWKTCFLGCLMALLPALTGRAQEAAADTTATSHPLAVSLLLGTSGLGGGVRLGLNDRWQVHAGITWMPFAFGVPAQLGDLKVEGRFDNAVGAVHLLADYRPFRRKPGFRVSAGLAYFFAMRTTMDLRPGEGYDYGDLKIKRQDIGTLTARIKRQGIAPYLGLGFLKAFRDNRFAVTFDLGTYYLAGPLDVHIEDTGYLSGNEKNEAVLKENLNNYRWLPLLQVAFNYRFGAK
ncbi:hypothetical protein [Taibaiella chishuiensis]|uniref:Outer membrane protein with beta-barrel domain n=1 Tax=Taibaiella chishuiensis TaxID=1434707 RepID=A0A2P8D2L3_9BACT|nr:hypothetical protein [Taibaiella chishuiensis]PSK91463.1 hypothetical protein B0I18_10546 [Taibaiella chishuiensis]